MKLLIEPASKKIIQSTTEIGLILALEHFAVESVVYFTLEEIEEIKKDFQGEIFVKANKNFMNEDLDSLKDALRKLNDIGIQGVFFYDLAVLQLRNEQNLSLPLVWNQTHMVNNYRTCNYYYEKGVEYALLGKEITLEEIKEILKKSKITCMVETVSKPSVAFSKRKLITNYYKDQQIEKNDALRVKEKQTGAYYDIIEDEAGTNFFKDEITNATSIIKELYEANCPYIIYREYGIDDFQNLVQDTINYLKGECKDASFIEKYKKLGDSTNFFFKKTIYKVK